MPKLGQQAFCPLRASVPTGKPVAPIDCELSFTELCDGNKLVVTADNVRQLMLLRKVWLLAYAINNLVDGRVMWGASAAENKVYARVDAFRFSRGVLAPDQFVRKAPMGGTILVR